MPACYLVREAAETNQQSPGDHSFIGGRPTIPGNTSIPKCSLCDQSMTFFFQLAFPVDSLWPNTSMAVFFCTSCANEDFLVPQMLNGPLPDADIPLDFLSDYQRNFRFVVFPTSTGLTRDDYTPLVAFQRLELVPNTKLSAPGIKIGGYPNWLLEDESPISYANKTPMRFLFQLPEELIFPIVEGAPAQAQVDYGLPVKPVPYYSLFLGNAAYFFGTEPPADPLVYVITQCD